MAKMESRLKGDFDTILYDLENEIMNGSNSATKEDESDFEIDGTRCAVRVFERYSMVGGNRVSMNITLFGNDEQILLSVITSGGSQAVIFKINTWGEKAFLDSIWRVVKKYIPD